MWKREPVEIISCFNSLVLDSARVVFHDSQTKTLPVFCLLGLAAVPQFIHHVRRVVPAPFSLIGCSSITVGLNSRWMGLLCSGLTGTTCTYILIIKTIAAAAACKTVKSKVQAIYKSTCFSSLLVWTIQVCVNTMARKNHISNGLK